MFYDYQGKIMNNKRLVRGILCLATFFIWGFVGNTTYSIKATSVEQTSAKINNLLQQEDVNGLVIYGTSDSPQIVQNHAENIKSNAFITPNKLYPIASLQKIFTGLAIQQLVNQGKVNLETKVSQYYPWLKYGDRITIRQLMTHTSGICDLGKIPLSPIKNQNAQLNFTKNNLKSSGKEKWSYSNSDYALLAGIITKVTGVKYADYIRQNFFVPYNINNIKFYNQVNNADQVVALPSKLNNKLNFKQLQNYMSASLGAGEIYCSPLDYWNFISKLLDESDSLLNMITTKAGRYYGGVYLTPGEIHANGSLQNYQSCFVADPQSKKVFLFFTNNISFKQMKNLKDQLLALCM